MYNKILIIEALDGCHILLLKVLKNFVVDRNNKGYNGN